MVSIDTAKQILKDLFHFDAELNPLYGELDDNFLVTAGNGEKSILKIMVIFKILIIIEEFH